MGGGQDYIKEDSKYDGMDTAQKIDLLFDNFKAFLKEKNRRYGNSALQPANIFSTTPAREQIKNRLDDKLSRIKKSTEKKDPLRKNDVADIFGYIALLMINENWLEFNELID